MSFRWWPLRGLGVFGVVFLLFVPLSASAQQKPEQTDPQTTLRVNVKLVNVFATVLDSRGAPVGSLTKDNFTVEEDGYPQSISHFERESDLPLSIVLAIDTSLSTRKDLRLEIESARRFIHSILRPRDKVMIMAFDTEVREISRFTSDLHTLDRGLDTVRAGGATALYDAVYLASDALQNRDGRKVLVIVTDGGDTVSSTTYQQALREAVQSEALVYSVIDVPIVSSAGRDTGGEHALIQLSHDTGGRYFYAANGADLDHVFKKIDEELRTQYLLGYYPTRRVADSDFRRISVAVTPPRGDERPGPLTVRSRSGYYTMPSK
jgi:Ca-activated chloride channel family protein